MVNTLLHGAIPPSLRLQHRASCNGVTARGFAPGDKTPRTFDPQRPEIGKSWPTFSPLDPKDMSTITTMTTTIITITTTLRKCTLKTHDTGEKRWGVDYGPDM